MKVFLTGGTGFIGQALTRALLARQWQVIALVRNPNSPQARSLAAMGARCLLGDVTNRESMRAAMTGADIVIHNAGMYEYGVDAAARQHMYAANVSATENVLSLALELNIPRSIHVSSVAYFGATGTAAVDETYQRQSPYSSYYEQTKAEAHIIAQGYQQRGLPLIIVCPSQVIGANDHSTFGYFQRLYVNGLLTPVAWAADAISGFVYVDDLAEGIALAAEKGRLGETYLLTGEPMNRRDMLNLWSTRPGGFKRRVYLPSGLAKLLFAPLEPLQRMIGLPAFISREAVTASTHLHFSNAKARRELGWQPRPARDAWIATLDGEIELLRQRKQRGLVSRLKPIEPVA